jgi:hypothetical protein
MLDRWTYQKPSVQERITFGPHQTKTSKVERQHEESGSWRKASTGNDSWTADKCYTSSSGQIRMQNFVSSTCTSAVQVTEALPKMITCNNLRTHMSTPCRNLLPSPSIPFFKELRLYGAWVSCQESLTRYPWLEYCVGSPHLGIHLGCIPTEDRDLRLDSRFPHEWFAHDAKLLGRWIARYQNNMEEG